MVFITGSRNKETITKVEELKVNDAISFQRKICWKRAYKHHAIVYEGASPGSDIFHVYEVSGESSESSIGSTSSGTKANIGTGNIAFKDEKVYRYTYADDAKRKDLKPVTVAKIIVDYQNKIKYNLLNNNCESFVCYCVTGKVFSKQTGQTDTIVQKELDKLVQKHMNDKKYQDLDNDLKTKEKEENDKKEKEKNEKEKKKNDVNEQDIVMSI